MKIVRPEKKKKTKMKNVSALKGGFKHSAGGPKDEMRALSKKTKNGEERIYFQYWDQGYQKLEKN